MNARWNSSSCSASDWRTNSSSMPTRFRLGDRHRRRADGAVEADRLRAQDRGDDRPWITSSSSAPPTNAPFSKRAARRPLPQLAGREAEPIASRVRHARILAAARRSRLCGSVAHVSSRGPSLFVTYSGKSGGAGRFLADIVTALPDPAVVACPPGELERDAARARRAGGRSCASARSQLRGERAHSGARGRGARRPRARDPATRARARAARSLFTWGMRSALAAAAALPRGAERPRWLARHHDFVPGPRDRRGAARARSGRPTRWSSTRARSRTTCALGRPVEVIPPGVDLGSLRARARPAERDGVLWLGAIVGWKRPELALEVAARTPDVAVRLAGAPLDGAGERLLAELRARAAPRRPCRPRRARRARRAGRGARERARPAAHGRPRAVRDRDRRGAGQRRARGRAGGRRTGRDRRRQLRPAVPARRRRGRPPPRCARCSTTGTTLADGARAARRGALRPRAGARSASPSSSRATARRHERERRRRASRSSPSRTTPPPSSRRCCPRRRGTCPAAQVVVADSGSSDDSVAVARRHGARTIELDNVGYGAAANAGVEAVDEPGHRRPQPRRRAARLARSRRSPTSLAGTARASGSLVPAVVLPDGSRQDVAQHEPGHAAAGRRGARAPRRCCRGGCAPRSTRGARTARGGRDGRSARASPPRTETLRRLGPFDPEIFLYARGPRPRPARRRRRDRDVVLAGRARPPQARALDAARRSAASRSSCSPAAAAR